MESLSHRHIGVVDEEFAVSSDAMEMFGVLDLETSFEGCSFFLSFNRTELYRSSLRLGMPLGQRFAKFNLPDSYTPTL